MAIAIIIALNFPLANRTSGQFTSVANSSLETTNAPTRGLPAWKYSTKAYEKEATRLLLQEANRVAVELRLKEHIPITTNDAFAIHIPPPAMGMLGTMSTTNYVYYFSAHRKFTGLDIRRNEKSWSEDEKKFSWPATRFNATNAFREGVEILKKADVDVNGLERDCTRTVEAVWPDGEKADHFFPDYWIRWRKNTKTVAVLEFIEPTHAIQGLHIDESKYSLTKPVEIPNLKALLMDGGTPPPILLNKMGLQGSNASTPTNAATIRPSN